MAHNQTLAVRFAYYIEFTKTVNEPWPDLRSRFGSWLPRNELFIFFVPLLLFFLLFLFLLVYTN